MAERISKKSSVTLRPRSSSKTRKSTRVKSNSSSNAIIFADPARHHGNSMFPIFSNNLVSKKPSVSSKGHGNAEANVKQLLTVSQATRSRFNKREQYSPTPVEQVPVKSAIRNRLNGMLDAVRGSRTERVKVNSQEDRNSPVGDDGSILSPQTTILPEDVDVFPFQSLPVDCKLKIFSYLSSHGKGRCAQVCHEWWDLIRTPSLWSHVSFSSFPFWCITTEEHNCLGNCYIRYRVRVKQFLAFLKDLRPILRSLEFKFDIGEETDGFLVPLENLIDKANTRELKYASMNWKETPSRPFWTEKNVACQDVMYKHRLRQRKFVYFFDLFTHQCPKVETLVMPFDWSDSSVDSLLRLKNLHSLVLEKYFVFQKLCQDLIDKLLLGLSCLRQLMLEVWTPSGHGLVFFSLVSKSIEYLDISQSRGFYLNAVHFPKLKVFRVARHPWNGPLVLADRINVPCIYDVLAEGAPNLERLNEHYLEPTWRECKYKQLEEVLKSVCSCRRHKSGWAM
ncbi:uncharacterized protein LOC127857777 [Dreissena polymorpha]|uniref:F-box domain-containing protein n=1 Tax=Dreissena polymorpha TaxID=45954 RepID=A0A9D4BYQ4_DREPO|nr:uncharacterized protein LOC127857777 [Dreissena polymorpha]XP_052250393.1 uncharacterized protein LOC127857777 [Dreissena polymorpha]KAH3713463.1 hypothetical protein DPMN_073256 [Dreissena polymorpha]